MAAPVVSGALDKQSYAPGSTVTLTVTYSDPDAKTTTITVNGTDAEGNKTTMTTSLTVVDPVTIAVSDDGARVWTKVSDTGSTAVFTTKA